MSGFSRWFITWLKSPTGPKTTHFWAPACNGFFPIQAAYDWERNPAIISREMQFVLMCYSGIFMRWSLRIRPANYLLFCVHLFNCTLQGRLFVKRLLWERANPELHKQQLSLRASQSK